MKFLSGLTKQIVLAATAISFLAFSPAQASSTGSGYIKRIIVLPGNIAVFDHTGSRDATPSCHTVAGRWAFSLSTPSGQAMMAHLLSAYSMGKPIIVAGKHNCQDWGDTESVNFFHIDE